MGNLLSCGVPIRVTSLGGMKPCAFAQLVLADGTIEELESPVTVAELMLEHPLHFVCHVNQEESSFDRDHPLPADVTLEGGEIYYLRSKTGLGSKSPLRQLQRSRSDSEMNKSAGSTGSKGKGGLFFRMREKGGVTQVTVSPEFIAQVLRRWNEQEQEREEKVKRWSGSLVNGGEVSAESSSEEDERSTELQMAYQMRLVSRSVSWRPKLATIQESSG